MTLKAVIFDLDDTLHDKSATLRLFATTQYLNKNLSAQGIHREEWTTLFIDLNNQRLEKTAVFARLAQKFGLTPELETALLQDFDLNLGQAALAYPGALALLQACKSKGLKTAIISNGRDAFQRSKIAGMGLAPYLDAVFTSGGFGCKKPELRIFQACLTELGVHAAEAVFIGDDVHADIEPALALGMRAILKGNAHSPLAWLCSNSLDEISDFMLGQT